MKRYLMILAMFVTTSAFSQKKDTTRISIPIVEGKIIYEKIVMVDSSITKDELYTRALKWMAETFVDSKEVIKVSDKESGKIVGNGIFNIVTSQMFGTGKVVSFMIDVTVKDGKYRVQAYQYAYRLLNNNYASIKYNALEPTWEAFNAGKSYSPKDDKKFFIGLNEKTLSLMSDLQSNMTNKKLSSDF